MANDRMKKVPRPSPQSGKVTNLPAALGKSSRRTLSLGLDILEYLAKCQQAATPSVIAADLRVSVATVNRALSVLKGREYIVLDRETQSYQPTGKFLALKPGQLLSPQLPTLARPIMHELSEQIFQSCNIAVISQSELTVITHCDSPAALGITVPVGFAYDIPNSAPGLAYLAFSGASDPSAWPDQTPAVKAQAWSVLRSAVQKAADTGLARMENSILPDVIDLSCPIYQNGHFAAVLTVPFVQVKGSVNMSWAIAALQMAAEQISEALKDPSPVA